MTTSHRPAQSRPGKLGVGVAPVATQASITVPAALTGGEAPTEAEHNALRDAVADVVAVLEAFGLTASA